MARDRNLVNHRTRTSRVALFVFAPNRSTSVAGSDEDVSTSPRKSQRAKARLEVAVPSARAERDQSRVRPRRRTSP